jgi:TFIIF-interacting CTD phosphatase-like protein
MILRQFAPDFLQLMAKFYEVVIVSEQNREVVEPLLNRLDSTNVAIKVYRESFTDGDGNFVKDLSLFKRPFTNLLVVDPSPTNSKYAENVITTKPWHGDKRDIFLQELCVFLEYLSTKSNQTNENVRDILHKEFGTGNDEVIHSFYQQVVKPVQQKHPKSTKSGWLDSITFWRK